MVGVNYGRNSSETQLVTSSYSMVQLNLNFVHACRHTHVLAHLAHAKLQKLSCACTVAYGIVNTCNT